MMIMIQFPEYTSCVQGRWGPWGSGQHRKVHFPLSHCSSCRDRRDHCAIIDTRSPSRDAHTVRRHCQGNDEHASWARAASHLLDALLILLFIVCHWLHCHGPLSIHMTELWMNNSQSCTNSHSASRILWHCRADDFTVVEAIFELLNVFWNCHKFTISVVTMTEKHCIMYMKLVHARTPSHY